MQNFQNIIHPVSAHFPIALLIIGFIFDLVSTSTKKESLRIAGWWCLVSGVVFAIIAAVSGLYAESVAPHNDLSHSIMDLHKQVAFIGITLFAILLVWRATGKTLLPVTRSNLLIYYTIGILAVSAISYSAHLGGQLVYEFGVGVNATTQVSTEAHSHSDGDNHHHSTSNNNSTSDVKTPTVEPAPKKEIHVHSDGSSHTH